MFTFEFNKKNDKEYDVTISGQHFEKLNGNNLIISLNNVRNSIPKEITDRNAKMNIKFTGHIKADKDLHGLFDAFKTTGGLTNIKSVDMSEVDMTSVIVARLMFSEQDNLKTVKLSKMPNIAFAQDMFLLCSSLKKVDLSMFGEHIVDTSYMFKDCKKLETVKVSKALAAANKPVESQPIFQPIFDGCNKLKISETLNINEKEISFYDIYLYDKHKDTRSDAEIGNAVILKKYIPETIVWDVIDRNITSLIESYKNGHPVDRPELLLSRNDDDYKFMVNHPDDNKSIIDWANLINYSKLHSCSLEDGYKKAGPRLHELHYKISDSSSSENALSTEDLLTKLKTGELRACYMNFSKNKLKKSEVMFFNGSGYIRGTVELKELDERFRRFIKGIYEENGKTKAYSEYIEDIQEKDILINQHDNLALPYIFAQASLLGWTPDTDLLNELKMRFFDKDSGRIDIPNYKGLWKLYNSSPCWNKNEDTTRSFMNIAGILGIFESDPKIRTQGENIFRAMTNYIPDKIKLDGYTYAKEYSAMPVQEINRESEITIRPGFPYKTKKLKEKLFAVLKEDAELLDIVGGENELKKTLENIYPLAELMDAASIYDMPDGQAKNFMMRIMKDLYVNTASIELPIDKKSFSGKEGKENLKEFRKFTEKYADDNEVKSHVLDSVSTHALFGGLKGEYNSDFAKFIQNHMSQILNNERYWSMGNFLAVVQDNWDLIQRKREQNKRLFKDRPAWKMSFDEIEKILSSNQYDREKYPESKYDEVAELSFNNHYDQDKFERTCALYDKMCERSASSIPDVEGSCGNYTYKMLALDDPSAIFFGQILDCCQQFGNAGESCMLHSCESRNGRVFGVFNEDGVMVGGSWVWRNGDTICFDNIEAANHPDKHAIVDAYKEAAEKLPTNVVQGDVINKVTFGKGYTDIPTTGFTRDTVNKFPIESVRYINDSRTQYILYDSGETADIETRALYEKADIEHINGLIGEKYESSDGSYLSRRDFTDRRDDYDEDEEDYEELHNSNVIDDDIDDCEIIDRVLDAFDERDLGEER